MDRDIPTFNQLVVNKIQQKNLQAHYQRLQNIKSHHSRLRLSSSHNSKHNRKALQLQEDRKTQIQKNNVVLFNKMMNIMKRNDPCNQPTQGHNRNNIRPSTELSRIEEQNRTMYERIDRQKPTIDHRKMQEQRKKQENILKFLGKYSVHSLQSTQNHSFRSSQVEKINIRGRNTKTNHYLQRPEATSAAIDLRPQRYDHPDQIQLDDEIDEREIRAHIENINRAKKVYSSTHETVSRRPDSSSKPQPIIYRKQLRTAPQQSSKDIILFKTRQVFSGQIWDISIVRCHQSYQIRASTPINGELYQQKMVLSEMEGNELLQETNYNYKAIVNRLNISEENMYFNEQGEEEGHSNHEEQTYVGIHQDIAMPMPRKPQHYFNPSHISQQNQEESYRPADSFQQGKSPNKKQKRLDSLGPEEELAQINFEEEDNINYEQQSRQKTEVKPEVEQIFDNESGMCPPLYEQPKKVVSISQRPEVQVAFQPTAEVNNYQQALDEEIL